MRDYVVNLKDDSSFIVIDCTSIYNNEGIVSFRDKHDVVIISFNKDEVKFFYDRLKGQNGRVISKTYIMEV